MREETRRDKSQSTYVYPLLDRHSSRAVGAAGESEREGEERKNARRNSRPLIRR